MVDATARRWHMSGRDRLYVARPAGEKLGWCDFATDEDHIDVPDAFGAHYLAVTAWRGADTAPMVPDESPPGGARPATPVAGLPPPLEEPNWEDLSALSPGGVTRERALALKRASPVRTHLARALSIHSDERA